MKIQQIGAVWLVWPAIKTAAADAPYVGEYTAPILAKVAAQAMPVPWAPAVFEDGLLRPDRLIVVRRDESGMTAIYGILGQGDNWFPNENYETEIR